MIGQNIPAPPAAAGIGGSTGSVDNAILRADGTGGATVQNSAIQIDDATTSTQNNVAIINADSQTNSALVLTPKGTGALIAGPKPDGTATGGNARGDNAICMVSGRNAATQVSSGAQSIAIGYRATASGQFSVALGNSTASGQYGVALGQATASSVNTFATGTSATASGQYSAAIGRSISASGNYSYVLGNFSSATSDSGFALGGEARADRLGMFAYSVSGVSGEGTSQRAWFFLRQKTTTNSAVELTLNGAVAGATNRLTIPSGKYLTGTINIAGIKSDGTAAASYIRQFSIKNVAGTTSLVGTVNTIGTDQAASTSISITANDTNDALKVDVTGITSETWRWVASVDVVEVAYGT